MLNNKPDVDIAICGAGPVGLAFAAYLLQQGIPAQRIVLLDAQLPEPSSQRRADPRSIALSYGSSQILQKIGAWPLAATAIEEIHISRRAQFGRTLIRSQDYSLPALGYVTRYDVLLKTLGKICSIGGVRIIQAVRVAAMTEDDQTIQLLLTNSAVIKAKLVIQAEGGQFAQQPGKTRTHDYQQTALVAQVSVSAPMMQRAFERFTNEGPLALLPQDDHSNNRINPTATGTAITGTITTPAMHYALVWCVREDTAKRLSDLPDNEFLAALEQAFGSRLGRFLHATPRSTYALGLNAGAPDTRRCVAIGNAAQTLHPVAGQGFNLGLRDAAVLARLLAQDTTPVALANFLSKRQSDRSMTIQLTDIMARIFVKNPRQNPPALVAHSLAQSMLGFSLGMIDGISPIKRLLAQQMMFGSR